MVTITEFLPRTGYEPPTPEEAHRLFEIALAAYPWLKDNAVEAEFFPSAMFAVGLMYRTAVPWSGAFYSFWTEAASDLCTAANLPAPNGASLFAAIVCHADVAFRLPDRSRGQLMEIGLNRYSGRKCSNRWRDLLRGKSGLLAPTPSDRASTPFQTIKASEGGRI